MDTVVGINLSIFDNNLTKNQTITIDVKSSITVPVNILAPAF